MTRGVPVLDPKRDLKGATPEKLAKALFRRKEPLPSQVLAGEAEQQLSEKELRNREVVLIMADAFEDVRKMCPSPEVWEKILEPLIVEVFMSGRRNVFYETDYLTRGATNTIRIEFRPDKFRSFVTVTAEKLIAKAVELEEQVPRHG